MANGLIGLNACLPVELDSGPNTIILAGWRQEIIGSTKKYALILEDGREMKPMASNALLQEISAFEQKFPEILFRNVDGSWKYKKPVVVVFDYVQRGKGSFVSPYINIRLTFKGETKPSPNPAAPQKVLGA